MMVSHYLQATYEWKDLLLQAGSHLFWTLTLISMIWTFGMMILRKADISEFFAEFTRFIIFTGFFWWILIHGPDFSNSIYRTMEVLGSNATHLHSEMILPSSLVDLGFSLFFKILDSTHFLSPFSSMMKMSLGLLILIFMSLIAFELVILFCASWILSYLGIFFLGFGGSRWTSDIAISYYRTVFAHATQMMVMIFLIGIVKTFINDYFSHVNTNVTLKELSILFIVLLISFQLIKTVPSLFSSMITGGMFRSSENDLSHSLITTLLTLNTVKSSVSQGIVTTATGFLGGMKAGMTAYSQSQGQGKQGKERIFESLAVFAKAGKTVALRNIREPMKDRIDDTIGGKVAKEISFPSENRTNNGLNLR